jgi:hypothetical protein
MFSLRIPALPGLGYSPEADLLVALIAAAVTAGIYRALDHYPRR